MMTKPLNIKFSPSSLQFDTVPDTTGFSNSVTLKGFTMKIEVKLNQLTPATVFQHEYMLNLFFCLTRNWWKLNANPWMKTLHKVSSGS